MNRTRLNGGPWNGRTIQIPDYEPKKVLMPLVDTQVRLLAYEKQTNGQYLIKGEQK